MRLHSVIVVFAILSFSNQLEGREWTDSTGRHRCEAELVARKGDKVWFKDAAGGRRFVDLRRLSAADQAFVLENERGTAEASARARTTSNKPALAVNATKLTAGTEVNHALFKLAGWSYCTPWYCDQPFHPHPSPPTPPLPDVGKRIYCGSWSTWHLIHPQTGTSGGTGSYLLSEGGAIVRHLVLLKFRTSDRTYWYFDADDANPGFKYWRFSNLAAWPDSYEVDFSADGTNWFVYEYCGVKLPR